MSPVADGAVPDRALTVLRAGAQALIEDLGRPGYAHLGVPPSGALDVPALRLANRLVGNPEDAAGLELLGGGLTVRAEQGCTVALTGAPSPLHVCGAAVPAHQPVFLPAGATLTVGAPARGLRGYLAVSGGIAVRAELGSRATDVLSGLGPPPVADGVVLPLGAPGIPCGADEIPPMSIVDEVRLPVLLGPRDDWFTDAAGQLAGLRWQVSPHSNRVGLRCTGPALRRPAGYAERELPSEGMRTGAVQVPPDGRPVVFLADHPTTGGYPVIGTVPARALPALAQAAPGTGLRFVPS